MPQRVLAHARGSGLLPFAIDAGWQVAANGERGTVSARQRRVAPEVSARRPPASGVSVGA